MSLLILLAGSGEPSGTVTPLTTADFIIKPPSFALNGTTPYGVPYLTDEGGTVLFDELGQPLIEESQKTSFVIKPPTLKARKVST